MNLFGLQITLANSRNGYVKQSECHQKQEEIRKFIKDENHETRQVLNTRFEDLKYFITNHVK